MGMIASESALQNINHHRSSHHVSLVLCRSYLRSLFMPFRCARSAGLFVQGWLLSGMAAKNQTERRRQKDAGMVSHANEPPLQMSRTKPSENPSETSSRPAVVSAADQTNRGCLVGGDFGPVCVTFFAGLGFMALLILGIAKWYRPDTAHLVKEANELVVPFVAKFLAPEPVEHMQYVLSVFLIPLFLLGCLLILRRLYRSMVERNQRLFTRVATVLLLAGTVATPITTYWALKRSSFL